MVGRLAQKIEGIFVYGTLKRGGRNHDRYFRGPAAVIEAFTCGRLFDLPAGYPALQLPHSFVLHAGSADHAEDALGFEMATGLLAVACPARPPPAARVFGEWIGGFDIGRVRPELDRLEGFRPGQRSLFYRVLAPVWHQEARAPVPAWVYVQKQPRGTPVLDGRWHE
jgi:gamma-glutamylcyclotransferase (GGCT)/AIG2-like uncharacterized protein YtfP